MQVITGTKEFFKNIPQVKFEGTESDNPLAFRWYDENKIVAGKPMKEILRFACAYWHSFVGSGADPFGETTHIFPWDEKTDAIEKAKDKMDAAFEFITKMNLPYYCFHDVDVVDYTSDVADNDKRLMTLVEYAKQKQAASGVKLLW
jgi:xylose isomerase